MCSIVSILVLLEIGLGVGRHTRITKANSSFNPCFVGNRSGSLLPNPNNSGGTPVSILVLLEIGLGGCNSL